MAGADESVIANTLRIILTRHGFDAAVAYNGQHAIEVAGVWQPDMLLSDVIMPGTNGIETAIRIRLMHPDCRVLLISGNLNICDLILNAHERGYDFEIVAKPILPAELIARISELLT